MGSLLGCDCPILPCKWDWSSEHGSRDGRLASKRNVLCLCTYRGIAIHTAGHDARRYLLHVSVIASSFGAEYCPRTMQAVAGRRCEYCSFLPRGQKCLGGLVRFCS